MDELRDFPIRFRIVFIIIYRSGMLDGTKLHQFQMKLEYPKCDFSRALPAHKSIKNSSKKCHGSKKKLSIGTAGWNQWHNMQKYQGAVFRVLLAHKSIKGVVKNLT